MRATRKDGRLRLTWRKTALGLGCAGIATAGIVWGRQALTTEATASPPVGQPEAAVPVLADKPASENARQPVAYVQGTIAITREELGEFLIARYGKDKLDHLINKRVIELACQARGIQVTEKEIDAALTDDLEMLKVNKSDFVSKVLKHYDKTLYEWREDVLRPKVYMTKYCQGMVTVTAEDLQNEFDKSYGPKAHCQIIAWPPDEKAKALAHEMYERIRKDPAEFDRIARMQPNPTLAASAGLIAPFGRGVMKDYIDKVAFRLKPEEVSVLIEEDEGEIILKCKAQIPPSTDKKLADVRAQLEKEIKERKVQAEVKERVPILTAEAKVHKIEGALDAKDHDYARQPVAFLRGNVAITREELGEYLIARHGADRLQHLVNERIIELACRARGIQVYEQEIEAALKEELASRKMSQDKFEQTLKSEGSSLYQWREDKIRPELYMTKYCQATVEVTPDDLKAAFEAYYGPKVHCQMILWPADQKEFAVKMYDDVRKGGADFDRIAKMQANPTLARQGGNMEAFGRHTTGNDDLEKVAFSLRPGEVSELIPTPQGMVALKCLEQIPAQGDIKLDDVREKLTTEIKAKKVKAHIPRVFKELEDKAKPMVFLKHGTSDSDVRKQVEEYLKVDAGKSATPKGN